MTLIPEDLRRDMMPVDDLVPYAGNAKRHPDWQVEQIAESVLAFGFNDPIGVWRDRAGRWVVVEGHGRLLAAKRLGMGEVPVVRLDHLDDEGRRAYALVHNKLTKDSGFDFEVMEDELANLNVDFGKYGFDVPDMDPEEYEPRDGSGEINLESFGDGRFAHECEACGFRFN